MKSIKNLKPGTILRLKVCHGLKVMFTGKGSKNLNYPSFSGTVVTEGTNNYYGKGHHSITWQLSSFEIDENPMDIDPGTVLVGNDGVLVMYTGPGSKEIPHFCFSGVCLGYDRESECVEQVYAPGHFSSQWFPEAFKPYHKPVGFERLTNVLNNIPHSNTELVELALELCKDKGLKANEEAFFVAGFESAIQYLDHIYTDTPKPGLDYDDLGKKFDTALNEIDQEQLGNWVDEDIERLRKEEFDAAVEAATKPGPELFLIMRGWIDPSERDNNRGYKPYAFTTDEAVAKSFCESHGNWTPADLWSISFTPFHVIPKFTYERVCDVKAMVTEFKPLMTYYCHHVPSGENWVVLGVNEKENLVILAGWPSSRAKLSDCIGFRERGQITAEEMNYLNKEFGFKQKSPGEAQ